MSTMAKSCRQDAGATGFANRTRPFAIDRREGHNSIVRCAVDSLQPGQSVRVNLSGMQSGDVLFHAAVTAAVGHIVRRISENPSKYLVKLLFSFRGVTEVEVPEDRITSA